MARYPIPRNPLLGFFHLPARSRSQLDTKQRACVTVSSGRAAIFGALRILGVGAGDAVLVPTYHCPTIVAPVVALGANPVFYPIVDAGVPNLAFLESADLARVRAIVVPQLFGLPQDLAFVRSWCDRHGVPLIEDCAHSLFGTAGARPVGEWGDFATASLTKFLPVGELGLLWSSHRAVLSLELEPCPVRTELKGFLDPLQISAEHGRLGVLGWVLRALIQARSVPKVVHSAGDVVPDSSLLDQHIVACDMSRVRIAPSRAARLIAHCSDLTAIAAKRRANYRALAALVDAAKIGRPLQREAPDGTGPYVLPVLIDNDPQPLYSAMRRVGFPVYRWDRSWPGTPSMSGDLALQWRDHLLQIPVHQSYSAADLERMSAALNELTHARLRSAAHIPAYEN